ncbi:TPA: hypothetical protein ACIFC2_003228 [Acinetobacter baumannii]
MNDPRSKINNYAPNKNDIEYSDESFTNFYELSPSLTTDKGKYWISRGQNFIVVYAELEVGEIITRDNQLDEYMIIQPDLNTRLEILINQEHMMLDEFSISIIPPGNSEISVKSSGRYIFIFSTLNLDLIKYCLNKDDYINRHHNIPEFKSWPKPTDGFKVRTYTLDVPSDPNRFGKIWRCTNFMVSFVPLANGPRDITKLSPHLHEDFEQCSFVLDGEFTHHIRFPWTSNKNKWKLDKHIRCKSPSMMVIPAKAIHTSCSEAYGVNQLIDIFSPPRLDFSEIPGWVLNSEDYPILKD